MSRVSIGEREAVATFIQTWTHPTPEDQARYVETVRESIDLLRGAPGFVSFTLHRSGDGLRSTVYAQWRDEAAMQAATGTNDAQAAHERMARHGAPDGTAYTVEAVFTAAPAPATLPGVEHQYLDIDGGRLHYVTAGGEGTPVLLVHGFPETWWAFRKLIPLLAEHHRVVAVDLRGFGDSSHGNGTHDSETLSDDLRALVDHLDLGPVHLSGQDLSGPTTFRFAAEHPDRLLSYTFIESGLPGFGLEPFMDVANGGSWHFGFFAAPGVPEMLLEGHEREFLSSFSYDGYTQVKNAIGPADVDEFLRSYASPGGLKGSLGLYSSMVKEGPALRKIGARRLRVPVLAIGSEGQGGYGDFSRATMAQVADDVRGALVPGSGHFIAQEQPVSLAEAMIAFYADVDGR